MIAFSYIRSYLAIPKNILFENAKFLKIKPLNYLHILYATNYDLKINMKFTFKSALSRNFMYYIAIT